MKQETLLRFKHNWLVFRDLVKYSFVKSKKDALFNNSNTSIMSFNLRKDTIDDNENCWQYRKNDVVKFILDERVHIVGMQEVMPHMYRYIMSNLGYQYDGYGINSFNGVNLRSSLHKASLGNCIIWDKTRYMCFDKGHFWLSDKPNRPSKTWGNTEPRTCIYVGLLDNVSKECCYIFNTHLDHTESNREKMADLISTRIKSKVNDFNVVFMGDLNINFNIPDEYHQLDSLNNMMDSTYNHIKNLTFNAWHPKLSKTLDAIYYNMNDVKCKVIDTKLSDHLPVVIYK